MSPAIEIRQSSQGSNSGRCIIKNVRNLYLFTKSCTGSHLSIPSPIFYTGQYPWIIKVYLDGLDHEHEDYVSIGFYPMNIPTVNLAGLSDSRFTVSIIGKDNKTYSTKSALFTNETSHSILFKNFVPQDVLLKDPNVLPNGELTISFEVTFGASNTSQANISSQKSLSKYLGNVFDGAKYTDFTFVVKRKEFNVHRAILAVRSPVFEAMFDNQMRESNEGQVEIVDVEVKVMEKLLRFLYTNELEDIKDVADKIFVAAEKYQIDELKEKCEDVLIEQLNITNVYYYLRLADENNGLRLKMKATELFHCDAKALIADADFKGLVDSLPGHLKTDIIYLLMTKL